MGREVRPRFVRRGEGEEGADQRTKNDALRFANKALRSESAMVDGRLLADFEAVLSGNAIYLPNFHCGSKDYAVLASLAAEMERAVRVDARTTRRSGLTRLAFARRRRAEGW
jgi:hypothetical protein